MLDQFAIKYLIKWFFRNIGTMLYLFMIILIAFIISAITILFGSRDYVINHWDRYRCDPFYSSFAGFYGKDATENAKVCGQNGFSSMLGGKLNPFGQITDMINTTLGDLGNVFEEMDGFGMGMVGFISSLASRLVDAIKNIMGTALFLFMKLKSILGKIYGIFTAVIYAMYSGVLAMESLAKGPIGSVIGGGGNGGGRGPGGVKNWATVWMETMATHGGGGTQYSQSTKDKLAEAPSLNQACCFIGETPVLMEDGSSVAIRDIQIGDRVKLGGRVLGVYKFWTREKLYRIDDITVSGSHIYYGREGEQLDCDGCRVSDVSRAIPTEVEGNQPYHQLWCLLTSTHKIQIGKSVWADFMERSDVSHLSHLKTAVNSYYGLSPNTNMKRDYYVSGWEADTPVLIFNTGKKLWTQTTLGSLELGDIILDHEGRSTIVTSVIRQYSYYNYRWNNTIQSGNQLVYVNGGYHRVDMLDSSVPVNTGVLYSVGTTSGTLVVGNHLYRDFWEVDDNQFWNLLENNSQLKTICF